MNKQEMNNRYILIQKVIEKSYLNDFKRPIGYFIAVKTANEDKVTVGISLCNDIDKVNKEIGRKLAYLRAKEYPKNYKLKNRFLGYKGSLNKELMNFLIRCTKYFKNKEIIVPNIDFTE